MFSDLYDELVFEILRFAPLQQSLNISKSIRKSITQHADVLDYRACYEWALRVLFCDGEYSSGELVNKHGRVFFNAANIATFAIH